MSFRDFYKETMRQEGVPLYEGRRLMWSSAEHDRLLDDLAKDMMLLEDRQITIEEGMRALQVYSQRKEELLRVELQTATAGLRAAELSLREAEVRRWATARGSGCRSTPTASSPGASSERPRQWQRLRA